MSEVKRRTVLGGLAALAVSLFTGPVVDAALPAGDAWQGDPQSVERRRRALTKLRLLNTIENSVFQTSKTYWHHADLLAAPIVARMIQVLPSGYAMALGGFDDVPGFQAIWSLDTDQGGYSMALVEPDGFTLRTDQTGVIREGVMQRAANGEWDVHARVGRAIERNEQIPRTRTARLRATAAQIATFFVPTLHADNSTYCCMSACSDPSCQGPGACCCCSQQVCEAGDCTAWVCCNSGYGTCTWCCEALFCGCFYQCLS